MRKTMYRLNELMLRFLTPDFETDKTTTSKTQEEEEEKQICREKRNRKRYELQYEETEQKEREVSNSL